MSVLHALVLGIVQGLTEFLPVSSSGHLILTRILLGINDAAAGAGAYLIFDILLHVGTLAAVVIVFWNDWWEMIRHLFRSRLFLLLVIASVPALIAALLFDDLIEGLFTGWFLGISFLFTSVLLILAEFVSQRQRSAKREPTVMTSVVMGCFQAVALLPGVSRSGASITGGLLSGLDRKAAAKFSFMMSAPAILGSLLFEGKAALENGYLQYLEPLTAAVGIAAAGISGYFAIRFMLRLIERASLNWFALYTATLGLLVLCLQLAGHPAVPAFRLPEAAAMLRRML